MCNVHLTLQGIAWEVWWPNDLHIRLEIKKFGFKPGQGPCEVSVHVWGKHFAL